MAIMAKTFGLHQYVIACLIAHTESLDVDMGLIVHCDAAKGGLRKENIPVFVLLQ